MKLPTLKSLAIVSLVTLGLVACGDDDDYNDSMSNTAQNLTVNLTNIEPLGSNYTYEGWIMVNGSPKSTGRFDVTQAGKFSKTFNIATADAQAASAFILTIEPRLNDPVTPSETKYLAGDLSGTQSNKTATLTVGHTAAVGSNFASASGSYILATPSSAVTTDNAQGIWWLLMNNGTPAASLSLPKLNKGWVYEGWIVDNGTPVSTGRFTMADMKDSDGAGATAGTDGCTTSNTCPPFPGQDYINPAKSLPGKMAVISVEPEMDDSPAPFAIKPLVSVIGADTAPTNQKMNLNVGSLPSGSVTIMAK